MSKYFLHYDEKAKINYCFLFSLFLIAERNTKEHINNIILYDTQKELSDRIKEKCNYNISASGISRILKNTEEYKIYFTKPEAENRIILNNNFKRGAAASNKFIILNEAEILFLLKQNNKLLNKYYLYLKYYCGFSRSKYIDTTANQILSAIGYSANCGSNKAALCKFNSLLLEQGFITITKSKDNKGYSRNFYKMNL